MHLVKKLRFKLLATILLSEVADGTVRVIDWGHGENGDQNFIFSTEGM